MLSFLSSELWWFLLVIHLLIGSLGDKKWEKGLFSLYLILCRWSFCTWQFNFPDTKFLFSYIVVFKLFYCIGYDLFVHFHANLWSSLTYILVFLLFITEFIIDLFAIVCSAYLWSQINDFLVSIILFINVSNFTKGIELILHVENDMNYYIH